MGANCLSLTWYFETFSRPEDGAQPHDVIGKTIGAILLPIERSDKLFSGQTLCMHVFDECKTCFCFASSIYYPVHN